MPYPTPNLGIGASLSYPSRFTMNCRILHQVCHRTCSALLEFINTNSNHHVYVCCAFIIMHSSSLRHRSSKGQSKSFLGHMDNIGTEHAMNPYCTHQESFNRGFNCSGCDAIDTIFKSVVYRFQLAIYHLLGGQNLP